MEALRGGSVPVRCERSVWVSEVESVTPEGVVRYASFSRVRTLYVRLPVCISNPTLISHASAGRSVVERSCSMPRRIASC